MIDLATGRLVIAYNPASTRAPEVESRVFKRLERAGIAYEVTRVQVAEPEVNISNIAAAIRPGDIILSAAGDGSAHAVMNAVMASGQANVRLGFLAFGNFNDLPRSLNSHRCWQDPVELLKRAQLQTVYPLEIEAGKALRRRTLMYATLGWTATAAAQYDRPEVRGRLQRPGQAFMLTNLVRLTSYYFRSRSSYFLPIKDSKQTTDIMAVNGPVTARFFRSPQSLTNRDKFLFKQLDVSRLVANLPFLILGMLGRLPAETRSEVELSFSLPNDFRLQLDGEVVRLRDVRQIKISKSSQPLLILATKSKI